MCYFGFDFRYVEEFGKVFEENRVVVEEVERKLVVKE